MAGVPTIMRAMLESIAPTLEGGRRVLSLSVKSRVGEGNIGGPLAALQEHVREAVPNSIFVSAAQADGLEPLRRALKAQLAATRAPAAAATEGATGPV